MGKVKRQRTKLRGKSNANQQEHPVSHQSAVSDNEVETRPEITPTENPFGNTKIDLSTLATRLMPSTDEKEDDRLSFISKGSIRKGNQQLKKKDKRKLRHEKWLEKVDAIQQTKKRQKERMKRAKTPVVGDLEPMMSALPELSEIIRMSEEAGKRADKRRQELGSQSKKNTLKRKQRQKLLDTEKGRFHQVLRHTAFKANPFVTINKHLALKIQQENQTDVDS